MTRYREPIPVEVIPNTVLAAAKIRGQVSAGRVGNTINSSGVPVIQTETINGYDYIFDIIPNLSGGRVINLSAEADKSSAVTIMSSYDANTQNERTETGQGPIQQTPERSHSLLVQFGAGNVRHAFEIDVAEGSTANCPGSHVEVSLLDYTFSRDSAGGVNTLINDDARALVSHANVAAAAHPIAARFTTKVLVYYQFDLDLADPPDLATLLDELLEANIRRSIVTVVP